MASNPMAVLARQVLIEAEQAFRRADALAAGMEPHLQKRYGDSAIYSYTNERAVPPGDVLLAAALAAGISIDRKLGIVQQETAIERQVEELRTQIGQLRHEMASLRGQVAGGKSAKPRSEETAAGQGAATASVVATEPARTARRREWARRSAAAAPVTPSTPDDRPASRNRRV